MNSNEPRFLLSKLTLADTRERCRLHSRGFALFTRLASGLLVLSLLPMVGGESLIETILHVGLVFALAWLLWFRSKPVFATRCGLAVGSGKRRQLIPWSRVLDVRELPWIRVSPPWYPRMWQVDLHGDQRFDFCGVRKAREIVIEFVRRSQAAGADTSENANP